MNKNYQIANRQLWFILFMLRSTIIISTLPVITTADSMQDAWLSALVTLVGSEIFLFLISLLDIRFPQQTIIEYSQKLLGRLPGIGLSFLLLWIFLQFSVIELRIYAEVIKNTFLPQTPLIFLSAVIVLAASLCVYNGIETLGRCADLLFFLYIIMIAFIIIIPLPEVDFQNLKPIFARGLGPVIRGAITPVTYAAQLWVLTIISSTTEKPKKILNTALSSIGLSLTILVLVAIITVSSLGPQETVRATFPVLTLIRSIEVSPFLQRTEVLIMFSWGFGLFISVSTHLFAGSQGISQLLNLHNHRNLVFPMGLIWIYMSIHGFENIFALNSFFSPRIFGTYSFFILILPLALLWGSYLVRKILNAGGKKT
ncbi:MAG: GerAB/ArcD/ProY family transporter [Bacillota bacterium]